LGEMGKRRRRKRSSGRRPRPIRKIRQAAYNLCVVTSKDRMDEALTCAGRLPTCVPRSPGTVHVRVPPGPERGTRQRRYPSCGRSWTGASRSPPPYVMLGTIYEETGGRPARRKVYRKAADNAELPEPDRRNSGTWLQSMRDSARGRLFHHQRLLHRADSTPTAAHMQGPGEARGRRVRTDQCFRFGVFLNCRPALRRRSIEVEGRASPFETIAPVAGVR